MCSWLVRVEADISRPFSILQVDNARSLKNMLLVWPGVVAYIPFTVYVCDHLTCASALQLLSLVITMMLMRRLFSVALLGQTDLSSNLAVHGILPWIMYVHLLNSLDGGNHHSQMMPQPSVRQLWANGRLKSR